MVSSTSWLLFLTYAATCVVLAERPSANPFINQKFYVNPVNAKEFDSSISSATGVTKENLLRMQQVPSAYWIDVKAKVRGSDTQSLEGILKDASSKTPPELVVIIWYNLPNRDCDALASNGQICCYKKSDGTCDYEKAGDCADGLAEYKAEYADPFVRTLQEYEGKLPIVVVVEPDSLPNVATNLGHPHCGNKATQASYRQGIKYALDELTTKVPDVAVYLDAAHGGWLGWEDNLEKFMALLKKDKFPMDKIRGFALNVANYQPLGIQCPFCPDQGYRNAFCLNGRNKKHPCCDDPCDLLGQYDAGNNEMNTAADLVAAAKGMLGMDAHVIIDTGRNGVVDMRKDCKNWCNPRGGGAGVPSTASTANTSLVDAYYWLKTPGESDGCSETLPDGSKCPRFDNMCASVDSLGVGAKEPPAPEAGAWFDYQVKQLALNANFEVPVYHEKSANKSKDVCDSVQQGGQAGPVQHLAMVPPKHKSNGSCPDVFQQCGGNTGLKGPDCCEEGCVCQGDVAYKQCIPPTGLWTCRPLAPAPDPKPGQRGGAPSPKPKPGTGDPPAAGQASEKIHGTSAEVMAKLQAAKKLATEQAATGATATPGAFVKAEVLRRPPGEEAAGAPRATADAASALTATAALLVAALLALSAWRRRHAAGAWQQVAHDQHAALQEVSA